MSLVDRTILQLLADPKVRMIAMPHVQDWMFDAGRDRALFKILSDDKFRGVVPDNRAVILTLHNTHKLPRQDIEYVIEILEEIRNTPIERIDEVISAIQEFVQEKYIATGVETLAKSGDIVGRARGIENIKKAINVVISGDEFYDFSNPDHIKTAKDSDFPEGGIIIKSSFEVINRNSTYGGYKYGDLVMFTAAPGVGKSTSMINEGAFAIDQGFRVCHLFLGDMSEFDGFMMYMTKWSKVSSDRILRDGYDKYISDELTEKFSRLRIKAWPSDTYSVLDIVAKLSHLHDTFPFNLLIVDYDLNIKAMSDSMYEAGGSTYGILKGFGSGRCPVIIGSQTKPQFWETEILPMECAAESSKKQHHIDLGFGIGKNPVFRGVGTANIFKFRRGNTNVQVRLHLNYKQASIYEISQNIYDRLIHEHTERANDIINGIDIDLLIED